MQTNGGQQMCTYMHMPFKQNYTKTASVLDDIKAVFTQNNILLFNMLKCDV